MSMPEQQLPSGLWVAGSPPNPEPPLPSDFTEAVPHNSCYPLGQYVRFLTEQANDPAAAVDIGRSDLDRGTIRTAFKQAQEEAIASCSRVCAKGCALQVIKATQDSRLEIVMDITPTEQNSLERALEFLETCIPKDEEAPLSAGAEFVKGVVSVRIDALPEIEEFSKPEVDDAVYAFLADFTGGRLHSVLRLMERLVETSFKQQTDAPDFEFHLEEPTRITVQDIVNLLLSQDRDFHYYLNLGSTPKNEIA